MPPSLEPPHGPSARSRRRYPRRGLDQSPIQVPLADNEPFKNSAGFAILPLAPSKAFTPAQIPFTSRNWDNRVPAYIDLSDRLGFRIIGLWAHVENKPPYKAEAPRIEQVAKGKAA